MNKEFVMRGQTGSGQTEVLNFSGKTDGYAYRITEFVLWPSTNIGGVAEEMTGTITAGGNGYHQVIPGAQINGNYYTFQVSVDAPMDADDTAVVTLNQAAGTVQMDVLTGSYFSGHLVC